VSNFAEAQNSTLVKIPNINKNKDEVILQINELLNSSKPQLSIDQIITLAYLYSSIDQHDKAINSLKLLDNYNQTNEKKDRPI
jgi:hypothetical protein